MKKSAVLSLIPIYCIVLSLLLSIAILGSKAVTVISENSRVQQQNVVIIDAGHGGVDGGATSCTGVLESQINLEIAKRLDDLMHLLGIQTKMIRITDTSVYTEGESIAAKKVSDLKKRVKIVNEMENAILISIHQNNFSDQRYWGAQVFYADTAGSKELANKIQAQMKSTLNPGSKRNIKKADSVYLLNHINNVGVLVECGFLSNPQEEAKLRSKEYQLQLCSVIASSCSDYLYRNIA